MKKITVIFLLVPLFIIFGFGFGVHEANAQTTEVDASFMNLLSVLLDQIGGLMVQINANQVATSPEGLSERVSKLENNFVRQLDSIVEAGGTPDRIVGVEIEDGTFNLTDDDVPNNITASNYLPLSGGSISGSLSVAGTTTFKGIPYVWPDDNGSNAQVLATDGSGNLSWSTVSSGSSFTTLDNDYGDETIASDFDFGGGTLQVPNSSTLPATCEVGDAYMKTDATSGQRWYLCESADSWVAQASGSGTSTITVEEVDGSPSVSASSIQFDQSDNLTVTDSGGGVARIDFTGGSDPWSGQYHPDREPSSCFACEEWANGTADLTWRWGNQDTTTETLTRDAAVLESTDNDSDYHCRWTDAPGDGDWTATTKVTGHNLEAQADVAIAALVTGTEASPTTMETVGVRDDGNIVDAIHHGLSSGGDYSVDTQRVTPYNTNIGDLVKKSWYLQLRYDDTATTITSYLSLDGIGWGELGSASTSGQPVSVGLCMRPISSGVEGEYHWFRILNDSSAQLSGQVGE